MVCLVSNGDHWWGETALSTRVFIHKRFTFQAEMVLNVMGHDERQWLIILGIMKTDFWRLVVRLGRAKVLSVSQAPVWLVCSFSSPQFHSVPSPEYPMEAPSGKTASLNLNKSCLLSYSLQTKPLKKQTRCQHEGNGTPSGFLRAIFKQKWT